MKPTELPNGNLLVPARAEGPRSEIGDGMREITSDDPEFHVWPDWLQSRPKDAAREASDEPEGG